MCLLIRIQAIQRLWMVVDKNNIKKLINRIRIQCYICNLSLFSIDIYFCMMYLNYENEPKNF
jgi:hypothetical protein